MLRFILKSDQKTGQDAYEIKQDAKFNPLAKKPPIVQHHPIN